MKSWINIPPGSDFSLSNIPFGICSFPHANQHVPRCCTAIGEYAVDLSLLADAGLLDGLRTRSKGGEEWLEIEDFHPRVVFSEPTLNSFMSQEKHVWVAVRNRLIALFTDASSTTSTGTGSGSTGGGTSVGSHVGSCVADERLRESAGLQAAALHELCKCQFHLPASIGDYTDFYSSREHATNVGTMFRGADNALQPNWLRVPIGYHGRSSTVFPSLSFAGNGRTSEVRRPCGQLQLDAADPAKGSVYGPCRLLDFELEVAFFLGGPPNHHSNQHSNNPSNNPLNNSPNEQSNGGMGRPLTAEQAADRIFGFVLMNDWSARDIQKWEYVPLGPFSAKNFATTISTWVVTPMALEPFRCPTSAGCQGDNGDPVPLDYLQDPNYGSYDVSLSVSIKSPTLSKPSRVCTSNLKYMYWSSVQQLVHHSVTGCIMNPGDLLASGTISGKQKHQFGSMLELSWKGSREVVLTDDDQHHNKEIRKFLKDGDTVIMEGFCASKTNQNGKVVVGRVGFGQCTAKILPAIPYPYHGYQQTSSAASPSSASRYHSFKLYGYWRSSCTWRVRIALAAKNIPYQTIPIHLLHRDQTSESHKSRNPMGQVPVLEFVRDSKDGNNPETIQISQSMAIIEFLEQSFAHVGVRLLPKDPVDRARAMEIAEIINSGMQPLQNLSVMQKLDTIVQQMVIAVNDNADNATTKQQMLDTSVGKRFGKDAIQKGLLSLESLISRHHSSNKTSGLYAIGSFGPTVADVCLIPQLYNARRFQLNVDDICPTLVQIEAKCLKHEWFRVSQPEEQVDAVIN